MINQIVFQVVIFLSNTIQTITGFAGTLLAMPFSIRLVGVEEAKAVLNIFTLFACFIITVQNYKYINKEKLVKMIGGMIIGMAVGVWLFERLSLDLMLTLYALLIILIALKKLFINREMNLPGWSTVLILVAAGLVHGMFLSGGALLVVYAVTVLKDKNEFRATIAPVWVILNSVLIVSHYQSGYYTSQNLISIGISILPLATSIWLGNLLYKKINQQMFLKITYVLLIISGVSLLI